MYQIAKDFLLPLLGTTVAIVVPVVLFLILPRARERRRTALDLFAAYNADEMRTTRNEVWAYFVIEVAGNPQERNRRFDQFLDYLTEKKRWSMAASPEAMAVFQKTSRVLDYLVFVEACLRHGLANKCLIRCFLAHFYLWWRDELIIPLRQRRQIDLGDPRFVPLWWRPLVHWDRLAGVPAQLPLARESLARPGFAAARDPRSAAPTIDVVARSEAACG